VVLQGIIKTVSYGELLIKGMIVLIYLGTDFCRACSDKTRDNGFKPKGSAFRLDVRKKFLVMRVVKHWSRLPRGVVGARSLETLKTRLNRALSNPVYWKMSLLTAGQLD